MNLKVTNLKEILQKRLKEDLPGQFAHKKMTPTVNGIPFRQTQPKSNSRKSAVLLLLCLDSTTDSLSILFTLRSNKLKKHSNQISFPGGMIEVNENQIEAAIRETNEEVGINPSEIEVLGKLSDLYVPPSNSVITPVVGVINSIPKLILNPDEVSEAFFIELGVLVKPEILKYQIRNFAGVGDADVPFYDVHDEVPLWGATALILSEFLEIIK
jgi:8-oxo-dGTP pyrophosphatase MutT (NUDIX family)